MTLNAKASGYEWYHKSFPTKVFFFSPSVRQNTEGRFTSFKTPISAYDHAL